MYYKIRFYLLVMIMLVSIEKGAQSIKVAILSTGKIFILLHMSCYYILYYIIEKIKLVFCHNPVKSTGTFFEPKLLKFLGNKKSKRRS